MYRINHDLKEVQVKATAGSMTLLKAHSVAKDLNYKLVFLL